MGVSYGRGTPVGRARHGRSEQVNDVDIRHRGKKVICVDIGRRRKSLSRKTFSLRRLISTAMTLSLRPRPSGSRCSSGRQVSILERWRIPLGLLHLCETLLCPFVATPQGLLRRIKLLIDIRRPFGPTPLGSGRQVSILERRRLSLAADTTCQGPGFRVQGSGFRVQGSGFRVQGSGIERS